MSRKKLPPELKAQNNTFKLYVWEVEAVKNFIKTLRIMKHDIIQVLTNVKNNDITVDNKSKR